MKKTYSTKKALIVSALSLFLCIAMLAGSTFAWFTDSVKSENNIIQTGNLDVAMYWAEGGKDVPAVGDAAWIDASKGAIFNHGNWEPGYTQARHILIANEGSLALNYRLRIVANGAVSKLADVIDVYYVKDTTQAIGRDLKGCTKIGTLTQVLGTAFNLSNTVNGSLTAGTTNTWSLVLKMQETADNDYQSMDLGCTFSVELTATQMAHEEDSFNEKYDEQAPIADVPAALVRPLVELAVSTDGPLTNQVGGVDLSTLGVGELDVGYKFEPTMSLEEAKESAYRYWHADFVVKADSNVAANSMALAGYYNAWCQYNDNKWIALVSPEDIAANTEIRLVNSMGGGGITVNWEELCNYGNDGIGFQCGAVDVDGSNEGTTITVELRMYETYPEGQCPEDHNGHKSKNCETGNYITVGVFTHTFGGDYETLDDGTVVFNQLEGGVVLYDTSDVTATDYTVPAGVTAFGAGSINGNFKTVTIPATVTDFAATGVSATGASGGAFKGSAVETVVLSEGMTEIPAAAFNGAKNLKSVNIPSTVDTIGVNAFRQTAITELTIPATVKNISTGSFRDMTALTKVTVEGNVAFENYAFRSVPNLTQVYLLGDDVTFNGSQFACHSDNGDATGITIYVANATVAARVYAAQASAYGYEVKVLGAAADGSDADEVVKATNTATLSSAINNGTETIVLGAGNIEMPSSNTNANITIAGTKDTVLDVTKGAYMDSANVTITGVTIKTSTGYVMDANGNKGSDYAALYSPNTTYVNCTFVGPMRVGRDGAKFIKCTFTELGNDYIWTYGNDVTFEGCTFNTDGKAILIYSDGGNEVSQVTVKDCVFNSTQGAKAGAINNQNCAAIEIHNYGNGVNLTTSGNTYDSNFSGEWRIKTYESGKPKIFVNGVEYTTIAIDGKTMTIDANKDVTVNE
ncbi:MAG: leucine-rich repeat protein [Clostridia bacterium]|nr:leucine-rich repeat protein [Clostridia bacterium]